MINRQSLTKISVEWPVTILGLVLGYVIALVRVLLLIAVHVALQEMCSTYTLQHNA